jgi:protein SCO1/2
MVALAVLAAGLSTAAPKRQPTFVPAMHEGDVVPDTALVDQLDRPLSLRPGGAPSIVGFAYTRCTDRRACSLVTQKFALLERMLHGTGIRLVELTLDPAYDRPAVLRRYAEHAGADPANWVFGTGRPADVVQLAERFGVAGIGDARGPLGHTEALAIVSGDGVLLTLAGGDDWAPSDVAAQAREDAGLRSNPFERIAFRLLAGVGAACGSAARSGVSLASVLAVFAFLVVSLGYLALRFCSTAFADRS